MRERRGSRAEHGHGTKPLFLLADSQLLFWRDDERPFLSRLFDGVAGAPRAAYIGASNGDRAESYDLFCAAMELVGVRDRLLVRSEPSEHERRFLERADVILLAGGDPVMGFRVIEENGVKDIVALRYAEGACLCGVSAGAVQLGSGLCSDDSRWVSTYGFVPWVVDVHDEGRWEGLSRALRLRGVGSRGIGIPLGGGMVFDRERAAVEPIRRPLRDFTLCGATVEERLLAPARAIRG